MDDEIRVELHITGLAILDTDSKMIDFIDTPNAGPRAGGPGGAGAGAPDHQHYSLITFRPDDYVGVGSRFPPEGTAEIFRSGISGDFHTSFPLRGAVTVGTEAEIDDETAPRPTIGTSPPTEELYLLDEIVSLGQLGYEPLTTDLATKTSASIRLIGGELYAAKRMVDREGEHQHFDKGSEVNLHFCEHIVWTRVLEDTLFVRERDAIYLLGLKGRPLRFSLTNLPTHGWLGSTDERKYFRHLKMLGTLEIAEGDFDPPGISDEGRLSSGSESCTPVKRP